LRLWQYAVMPKRISKKATDANQTAYRVVQAATTDAVNEGIKQGVNEAVTQAIDRDTLSHVMAQMGRKGGKIGGKRSLETMSAADRKKRARKAAHIRWTKPKK
jgi:hypothetical protein